MKDIKQKPSLLKNRDIDKLTYQQYEINAGRVKAKFHHWLIVLSKIAPRYGFYSQDIFDCPSDWKEYFDNGYTPEDSILEEISYG